MIFRNKAIAEFTESDLAEMIKDKEQETVTVEFKEQMYSSSDAEIKEMLKDISAMANAYGGLLFIGIAEDVNHCASEIIGVDNCADHESRINKSCRANIEENIYGLETRSVDLKNGKNVLILQIPESTAKPHMVKYQKHWRFYRRVGTDNHPMSSREIKDMILFQEYSMDKMERFLVNRKSILSQKYGKTANLIISVTPRRFLEQDIDFTQNPNKVSRIFCRKEPMNDMSYYHDPSYSYYGLESAAFKDREKGLYFAKYVVFHRGYIEVVIDQDQQYELGKGMYIPHYLYRILLVTVALLKRVEDTYNIRGPYSISLWATNTGNLKLMGPDMQYWDIKSSFMPYEFNEPEFEITHTVSDLSISAETIIDPIFRRLLIAFNIDPNSNQKGEYIRKWK